MRNLLLGVVSFGLMGVAGAAHAGPAEQGQLKISGAIGADFSVDGDVHGGTQTAELPGAAVAGLSSTPVALPAGYDNAQLNIGSRSFDDIYDESLNVQLEGAYGLGGGREVFGAVGYVLLEEGDTQVGTADAIDAEGVLGNVTVPVFGSFSDYEAYTIEAGVRQFFNLGSPFQPYVAGRIGAAFVDEITANFTIPAVGFTANNVPFYDKTTVLTAGLDVGVEYTVTPNASIALETGLRYAGDLDGDDSTLSAADLSEINEEGSRVSVPVTLRARFAFN